MATRDEDRTSERTSFEVDRGVEAQPPREDLLEPDEIDFGDEREGFDEVEPGDGIAPLEDAPLGDGAHLPDDERLPESQGDDVVASERLAEDAADRPPLHDEEE